MLFGPHVEELTSLTGVYKKEYRGLDKVDERS